MSSESASTACLTLPSDCLEDNLAALPDDAISSEAADWAQEICDALSEHHFGSGRSPNGLAAAAIYAAALVKDGSAYGKGGLPQWQVAECCDTSEMTVRSNYRRVVAAWAEVNEDDLDRDQLQTFHEIWDADVDVPDREERR